jgi:tetratricopeptide (TPR) repeat protein
MGVDARISACLIAKNEQAHLERCLSSVKPYVDEIVLVDTGSTDDTVQIAESFGCKIASFQWVNDFSAARNVSLETATGDWALWMDADEELTESAGALLRGATTQREFGGYFLTIVDLMEEEEAANAARRSSLRLFQLRPEIRFRGRIHEQISPAIEELGLPIGQLTQALILHHGFKQQVMDSKDKLQRNISMLLEEVRDAPEDAFHWFNLALAYSSGQMHEQAAEAAAKAVERLEQTPNTQYAPMAFQLLSTSLMATGRLEEALEVCEKAEKRCNTILSWFDKAQILLGLGRLPEALVAINRCISMPWPEGLAGDYAIKTHKARVVKSQVLIEMKRYEDAGVELLAALKVAPNDEIANRTRMILLKRALG